MSLDEIRRRFIPVEKQIRFDLLKLAVARGMGPQKIAFRLSLGPARWEPHRVDRFLLMKGRPKSAKLDQLSDIALALGADLTIQTHPLRGGGGEDGGLVTPRVTPI